MLLLIYPPLSCFGLVSTTLPSTKFSISSSLTSSLLYPPTSTTTLFTFVSSLTRFSSDFPKKENKIVLQGGALLFFSRIAPVSLCFFFCRVHVLSLTSLNSHHHKSLQVKLLKGEREKEKRSKNSRGWKECRRGKVKRSQQGACCMRHSRFFQKRKRKRKRKNSLHQRCRYLFGKRAFSQRTVL